MKEEFHGIRNADNTATIQWKLLYGWNSLNVNVWLPSLSELVGITGEQSTITGCYLSVMQGLNTATWGCVDSQGGAQFAFFAALNQAGGGEAIWSTCNRQQTWLRSAYYAYASHTWHTTDDARLNASTATASLAVHPALSMQATHRVICN